MLVLEIIIVYVYFLKETTKHTRAHTHKQVYKHSRFHRSEDLRVYVVHV